MRLPALRIFICCPHCISHAASIFFNKLIVRLKHSSVYTKSYLIITAYWFKSITVGFVTLLQVMPTDDLVFVQRASSTSVSTVTNDSDDLEIIYKTSEPSVRAERRSDHFGADSNMQLGNLTKEPTTEMFQGAQMLPFRNNSVNQGPINSVGQFVSYRATGSAPPTRRDYSSSIGEGCSQALPLVSQAIILAKFIADYSL